MKRSIVNHAVLAAALCAAGVARAETWSGGGADANWTTGGNWGGTAPANPTANTITYNDNGVAVTGIVNPTGSEWEIGPLTVTNTTGTHAIDLGGKRLRVGGLFRVGYAVTTSRVRFDGPGTLQLGSSSSPINVTIGEEIWGGSAYLAGYGEVSFGAGSRLEAYLNNLRL